jgi:hypothetical protein
MASSHMCFGTCSMMIIDNCLGLKKNGICNKLYNQFFVHAIFGISHVLDLNILFWIGIYSPMASSTLIIFFSEILKNFPKKLIFQRTIFL